MIQCWRMSLRQYLFLLSLGTAVSLVSWFVVLLAINPVTSGTLVFFAFYLTLGFGLAGLFSMVGTTVRASRNPEAPVRPLVTRSLRQGILLTTLVLGSLLLMAAGLFTGLLGFLVILGAGLLEMFFLFSGDRKNHPQEVDINA